MAGRGRTTPTRLDRHAVENREVTVAAVQQLASQGQGIAAESVGDLVDETFLEERGMRVTDRSPEADRNGKPGDDRFDPVVTDDVFGEDRQLRVLVRVLRAQDQIVCRRRHRPSRDQSGNDEEPGDDDGQGDGGDQKRMGP